MRCLNICNGVNVLSLVSSGVFPFGTPFLWGGGGDGLHTCLLCGFAYLCFSGAGLQSDCRWRTPGPRVFPHYKSFLPFPCLVWGVSHHSFVLLVCRHLCSIINYFFK